MLLQTRKLPWPTLYLAGATIMADARLSRPAGPKENSSEHQWLAFWEEYGRLRDQCRAAVEKLDDDGDFAEFMGVLDNIRRGLIKADAGSGADRDKDPFAGLSTTTRKPADVRSITWLLRAFVLGPVRPGVHHSYVHPLYEADVRAFPLREQAAERGDAAEVEAYDRLYRECELAIAAFFEDSDMTALTSRLESIAKPLTAMGSAPPHGESGSTKG